jgi:hypothetical protein
MLRSYKEMADAARTVEAIRAASAISFYLEVGRLFGREKLACD